MSWLFGLIQPVADFRRPHLGKLIESRFLTNQDGRYQPVKTARWHHNPPQPLISANAEVRQEPRSLKTINVLRTLRRICFHQNWWNWVD